MARWRPPPPRSSLYITPSGAARLRDELDRLWRVERPQVTRAVAAAAAEGDRSENAEYIYGKKRLREIDRRVRHLRRRLDGLKIVDTVPHDPGRVFFGAWVEIALGDGPNRLHRIVGPDEFDMDPRYISMDAPLGKALIGRASGDRVAVATPAGTQEVEIVTVSYDEAASGGKSD